MEPKKEATDKVGTIIFDIPIELQGHKRVENGEKNEQNCSKPTQLLKCIKILLVRIFHFRWVSRDLRKLFRLL